LLILGIDTTEKNINIAITRRDKILFELESLNNRTEELINQINATFTSIDLNPDALDLISVITGPGGYTGTRSGVVVAKTLAQFLNIPIIGFNKLEAIGLAFPKKQKIAPAIDVKRNEVYFSIVNEDNSYEVEPQLISFDEWKKIVENRKDVLFLAHDFKAKKDDLQFDNIDFDFYLKPSAVAMLSYDKVLEGEIKRFHEIEPFYIREAI
jgi:tRNA threonylcarbamoyladenosine biosynthesis protein TsaB